MQPQFLTSFPGVVPWHLLERSHVNFFSARSLEQLLQRYVRTVRVGYFQRFPMPDAPPIYKGYSPSPTCKPDACVASASDVARSGTRSARSRGRWDDSAPRGSSPPASTRSAEAR